MIGFRHLSKAAAAGLLALALAAPAFAEDLTLAKDEATPLVESDVGKPYWTLEAQCAGMYGAAYAYETEHRRSRQAEDMKQTGVDMLQNSLARLQADRGLDRNGAMALAADQVEAGRALGKAELAKFGDGAGSGWNLLRSACLDIAQAAQRHAVSN